MPDAADQRGDGADHGRLVVDHQDAQRRLGAHPVASRNAVTNWLPPAGLSSIHSRPSMAPTSRRAAKRPTPVPGASVSFEPDEWLEDALAHLRRHPRAVVADRDAHLAVGRPVGHHDLRAGRRVLRRVLEQQLEHLRQARRIAECHAAAGCVALEPMAAQQRCQAGQHLVDDRPDIEALDLDRQKPIRADRLQDRVDQVVEPEHLAGCRVVPAGHLIGSGGIRRLGQQVEVGADDGQRRAQLVGDDRDQLRPRLVDAAQAVELRLRLQVQAATLDDPGKQRRDRRQPPDLGVVEVAARLGLDVEDADDAIARPPAAPPGWT